MSEERLRRAIFPLSLLTLPFLFVHACVPEPMTDLRIAHVSRVPASALPLTDTLRTTLMVRRKGLWKVLLLGDASWVDQVRQHELNSYAVVVDCNARDHGILALGPYAGQVRLTYYGDGFENYRPASRTVQYEVFLPEAGRHFSVADPNAPMPSYDLNTQRLALCIKIAGGAMHAAYSESNEVHVALGNQL